MDHAVSGSTFIFAIFAAFGVGIVVGLFMAKFKAAKVFSANTGGGAHKASVMRRSTASANQLMYTDDLSPEVLACLPSRKIEAIKLYREETGVGLKEAKDRIDAACSQMEK